MSNLILGCGYLGSRVAKLWLNEGQQVAAVTRSQERLHELAQQNLKTIQADVTNPESLAKIFPDDSLDTVLFSVGYDRPFEPVADGVPRYMAWLDEHESD